MVMADLGRLAPRPDPRKILYAEKDTPAGIALRNYVAETIEGIRIDNDNAQGDEVIRNQGKLAALKAIAAALSGGRAS